MYYIAYYNIDQNIDVIVIYVNDCFTKTLCERNFHHTQISLKDLYTTILITTCITIAQAN